MVKPNFLIVGAAKAGTTSLHYYLDQHPDIFLSDAKEPEYFAYKDGGADFVGPGDEHAHRFVVRRLDAYLDLFATSGASKVVGEASTIYLYNRYAAENIRQFNPEMKIIAILRDPTDRAWSHFKYLLSQLSAAGVRDVGQYADFRDAVIQEAKRVRGNWGPDWHFINRGRYVGQLSRFYARFPPGQIKVYLYDDLKSDALRVVKDIFRFVGVDDGFDPDVSTRLNAAAPKGIPRATALRGLANAMGRWSAAGALVRVLPQRIKDRARGSLYLKPTFDPKLRREISDGFQTELLELEGLIGRDLARWRTSS